MAIIMNPAGDSTSPASSAVYPNSVCTNCGIRIVVPYSENPSTNINANEIANDLRLNNVRFNSGRCPVFNCRNSHQISVTNDTTISTVKNVMMCELNQSSSCPLSSTNSSDPNVAPTSANPSKSSRIPPFCDCATSRFT